MSANRMHLFLVDREEMGRAFQATIGETIDLLTSAAETHEKVLPYLEMALGDSRRAPRQQSLRKITQVLRKAASPEKTDREEETRRLEDISRRMAGTIEEHVCSGDASVLNWILHAFSLGLTRWTAEIVCDANVQVLSALLDFLWMRHQEKPIASYEAVRDSLIRIAGPSVLREGGHQYSSQETLAIQPLPLFPAEEGDYALRALAPPQLDSLIETLREIPDVARTVFPNPERSDDLSLTPKVRELLQHFQALPALRLGRPLLVSFVS